MDLTSFAAGLLAKKFAWLLDRALGGIVSEYAKKFVGPYIGLKPTINHINKYVGQLISRAEATESELLRMTEYAGTMWTHNEQLEAQNITLTIRLGNVLTENESLKARIIELGGSVGEAYVGNYLKAEDKEGARPT